MYIGIEGVAVDRMSERRMIRERDGSDTRQLTQAFCHFAQLHFRS